MSNNFYFQNIHHFSNIFLFVTILEQIVQNIKYKLRLYKLDEIKFWIITSNF